jgi:hypothetical protein
MWWCVSCLLLCVFAVPALADSLWHHNGSILRLRGEGSERSFEYSQPRAELREAGVTVGTVLFDGKVAGGSYSGTAFRFSQKCGAVGYAVKGSISADTNSLTLFGRAPKRNRKCQIIGHRTDVLVFRSHRPAEQQLSSATSAKDATLRLQTKTQLSEMIDSQNKQKPNPKLEAQVAELPIKVMGCKSRKTFDQWVEAFRRANTATQAQVVAQGLKTRDCAVLSDGPVEIVQADESYLCVRPKDGAVCYWTLRTVFESLQNSPG